MDAVWVLLVFNCFFLSRCEDDGGGGNGTESKEEKAPELELFPPSPTYAGQTRMPRTLFKKLHSGAAFLTGLKLGAILSKKGFELGHGKIASSHSFQIFGKSVNSAMSLSYGNAGSLLPLVDDEPDLQAPKTTILDKQDHKVIHVTLMENSFNGTEEAPLRREADEDPNNNNGDKANLEEIVVLYENNVDEEPEVEREVNFLKEHNKRVKEFNDSILRRKTTKF